MPIHVARLQAQSVHQQRLSRVDLAARAVSLRGLVRHRGPVSLPEDGYPVGSVPAWSQVRRPKRSVSVHTRGHDSGVRIYQRLERDLVSERRPPLEDEHRVAPTHQSRFLEELEDPEPTSLLLTRQLSKSRLAPNPDRASLGVLHAPDPESFSHI